MIYWGDHMGVGDWIFSILGTLIILALIVGLIVWLVSARNGREGSLSAPGASPREILDRRLARGELTVEQYEQLRETLAGARPRTSDSRPRRPARAPG